MLFFSVKYKCNRERKLSRNNEMASRVSYQHLSVCGRLYSRRVTRRLVAGRGWRVWVAYGVMPSRLLSFATRYRGRTTHDGRRPATLWTRYAEDRSSSRTEIARLGARRFFVGGARLGGLSVWRKTAKVSLLFLKLSIKLFLMNDRRKSCQQNQCMRY